MSSRGSWRNLVNGCLLAAGLLGASGCFYVLHPVPQPDHLAPCLAVPRTARDHVYVLLIDTFDPLGAGHLAAVRNYIQYLGFTKTWYGQIYHVGTFGGEVRRLSADDPDARFVLISSGWAASRMQALADTLQAEGIPVQLVVQLNSDAKAADQGQPESAGPGAVLHLGAPDDPQTRQSLAWQLAAVAATVPAALPATPGLGSPETAPVPRPVNAGAGQPSPDGWDLLKPSSQLRSPPPFPALSAGKAEMGQAAPETSPRP